MRTFWNKWYNTQPWKRRRNYQLMIEPWCKMCMDHGIATPATIVDHIVPHQGNYLSFRTGALQSLCKSHHDGSKHEEELKGYYTDIGIDGWPLDKRHPANSGIDGLQQKKSIPNLANNKQ